MKLNRLIIKAYGHFTNKELDFTSPVPGLHIIHGANEAGKSTALRALKGLFFGIPERTTDNFLHSYEQLLIGGCLEAGVGETLTFYRRKRRVGDLLDAAMEQLDPARLPLFLGGIGPALFDSLYGIDQETLVSGGRDILAQRGDVGQALFAAGAGLSSLHGIITDLEKEAADIFKPSGSKPELNRAIREYTDCLKESRALSLSTHEWEQCRRTYDSTITELADGERQVHELNSELIRLKRLEKTVPKFAVKNDLTARIATLGHVSRLPSDFPEQLRALLHQRATINTRITEARSQLQKLESDRQELIVCRDILDQEETVDSLHQRLGVERQARKDRPGLHEAMIRGRTQAESLLRRVAPECELSAVDELKGVLGTRQLITKLGNRFAAVEQGVLTAQQQLEGIEAALAKAERSICALADVPDLRPVSALLALATRGGDLDATIRTVTHDARTARTAVETRITALGI